MKLGIISDTHDRLLAVDQAFDVFAREGVGLVIHCGDWTKPDTVRHIAGRAAQLGIGIRGVLGNRDLAVEDIKSIASEKIAFIVREGVLRFEIDGKSIAAYHGHHNPTLKKLLASDFDVLCLGHSHKPRYDRIDHKIIINPGSTAFAIPRSIGWHPSVAIYDTELHEAELKYF